MLEVPTIVPALIAFGGLVIAIATYVLNRASRNEQSWRTSEDTVRRVRQKLKGDRSELQVIAQRDQAKHLYDDKVPLLVKPGWIPQRPLPLSRLALHWQVPDDADRAIEMARSRTTRYWPRGRELQDRYHEVIRRLESPDEELFFDGSSYRLLDVAPRQYRSDDDKPVLTFTQGWYFDNLDTSDVLSYETAFLVLRKADRISPLRRRNPLRGRYRLWLGDPFDFKRRCAIPGVNTLTIRRGEPAPTFILHRRSASLAQHQGVTHVTPAGEFQPENLSGLASDGDLNLWRNICREYGEELLDIKQARGQPLGLRRDNVMVDTIAGLNRAEQSGSVEVYYLGIGLDPLSWKPEILTVAIFEPAAFDEIFADIVDKNEEGELVFGDSETRTGIRFTEYNIDHWARIGRMLTAGQACLRLAWYHRDFLRLTGD